MEIILVIGAVLCASTAVIWWCARCRHPNPHYVRAAGRPAHYVCYECGKSWPAEVRDPAWAPTHLTSKFAGYDEGKAARAAKCAVIAEEQRRLLAAHRTDGLMQTQRSATPSRQRKRERPANVVDMNSRKPA